MGQERWLLKIVVFELSKAEVSERTLESPLDCKEIKAVNPKANQSNIFQ